METTETGTVLYEAPTIAAAMTAMREARGRIFTEGAQADGVSEALRYGQLAEALDMAGDALFNVLNVAANMLDCREARAAIDAGRSR